MVKTENDNESEVAACSEETSTSKSKPKSQGKKRKRPSSESSNDNGIVLADNALETERNVHASAVKNNLDETSVRKIIKRVVTNDHVMAFVKLQEEEEDSSTDDKKLQPKLTRAKVKELKKGSATKSSAWDLEKIELTPIKHIPVKTRPEVKALIAQELPEDEDDEEYEPTHDDVPSDDEHTESCSDLDSQPRTPATPAPPESPRVVKDGPFKVPQDIFTARRKLELEEEQATIALRTRSKLSLSSTSIEHIESTFVPPDDLPMQDVDDLWNEFLNECLNPASAAKNEDDDEADPEYNVAADPDAHDEDEESLSNSIIKISKKELNDLVTELFSILPGAEDEIGELPSVSSDTTRANTSQWEGKQEPLSDDETGEKPSQKLQFEKEYCRDETEQKNVNDIARVKEINVKSEKKVHVQKNLATKRKAMNSPGPRISISTRNKNIEISIEEDRRDTPAVSAVPEAPPSLRSNMKVAPQTVHIQVESDVTITREQILILQQQLRQHIQLATSNFMQTVVHPVHWKLAPTYKEYVVSLTKLAESKEGSVVDVCNLKPAQELITTWEKSVTEDTEENRKMIEFLQSEVEKSRRRINNNSLYGGQFHDTFKKVVANSTVFLYPYLLPSMPYRPDPTRRSSYLHSEDTLIVLGLEQFWPYVESNPDIFKLQRVSAPRARRGFAHTCELVCKHMLPWMAANRLAGHVTAVRAGADDNNPIYRYFKYKEVPQTEHLLVPYNPTLTLYEQPEHEMPRLWVRYLAKTSKRFRKFLHQRSNVESRRPTGVQIHPGVTPETNRKPLPIDFTKQIISSRATLHEKQPEPPLSDKFDVNIQTAETGQENQDQNSVLVAKNFYRLVETSTGAYLVPMQVDTQTVNSANGPITTPAELSTIVANNLPGDRSKTIICSTEHCMCCVILRKICKQRQSLITEYFSESEVKKCDCNSVSHPKISNRLRLLVKNHKKVSEVVFKELEKRLKGDKGDGTEVEGLDSKDIAHVLAYQLKVFTQASMSKRIHVKKRVSNLLSHFDLDSGDPTQLAMNLFKTCDVELMDLYLDFLGFLTPEQAEKMGAFKDYFTRNCAKDLMDKIEEQVTDKEARHKMLTQLKSTFTQPLLPCEMCAALLGTMGGYPTLARYCFYMFPHTMENRAKMYKAAPAQPSMVTEEKNDANDTTRDLPSITVDYEADHSSSGDESDAMSVDVDPPPAPAPPVSTEEAATVVKTEPPVEVQNFLAITIKSTQDDSDHSMSEENNLKIEETADWTKDEDRLILQVLQEHLTREERKGSFQNNTSIIDLLEEKNVYVMLYESLTDRSLNQIKERVLYLLTMLVISERDS